MIKYKINLEGIMESNLQGFFVGWKNPLSTKEHIKILENSQYKVLAIDTDTGKVIGFINALSDNVNFAFIPMIEILPEYQEKGIGTELMNRMLEELKDIPCIDLMCDKEMQSYYERFDMLKSHGMVLRRYL
ncbi:GNAT family N-acetyltransferase [Clostridium sp. D2Q-11]|uniref:GNAT family N-acetyltransferase n=1 Tax=Anaeromonas frigoriresistens TaxID=2683708 RepID=A0A942UPX9_9FIRM|nr:GNAT family N-acetyltransferase [Anaeromonas frigoriresistens]MBS4537033.1 GNAT family N-acetyltransferase [Anaeromonas frigoriresistens]